MPTHEVENVPPPLPDVNRFTTDALLMTTGFQLGEAQQLDQLGARAGTAQAAEWGRLANENPPELRTHDRYGNRIDEVEFHPSWHWLMERAVGHGLHAHALGRDGGPARTCAGRPASSPGRRSRPATAARSR